MDSLKDLSITLGGKIQKQTLFDSNFDEASNRKLTVKDYRQYKIRINEYQDLYSLGISVNSDLALSINKSDWMFGFKIPKNVSGLSNKVYVRDETYTFDQNEYVISFWNSLVALLNKIGLSESEGVFFYNNGISFSLKKERDVVSILNDIIDLINANKNIFKRETKRRILSARVPENLKPLIPLLKKYAVSDDSDREQLKERMTGKEKQKLINTVRPFFNEINAYLDSFKDNPLSEEAMSIGDLAELVSELEIEGL